MNIEERSTYTVKELEQILKIGKRSIQKMLHDGIIRSKNIGTEKRALYRVYGKDILDFLNK